MTTVPRGHDPAAGREMVEARGSGRRRLRRRDAPLRPAPCLVSGHRRPAAVDAQRDGHGPLNVLLGAVDVPGGLLNASRRRPDWMPKTEPDGLLVARQPVLRPHDCGRCHAATVKRARDAGADRALPRCPSTAIDAALGSCTARSYGLPYKAEVLIQSRCNIVDHQRATQEAMGEALRRPSRSSCSLNPFHDETSQFADLLLPDTHSLERLVPLVVRTPTTYYTSAALPNEHYTWNFQQPVVKAVPARPALGRGAPGCRPTAWASTPDFNTAFNGAVTAAAAVPAGARPESTPGRRSPIAGCSRCAATSTASTTSGSTATTRARSTRSRPGSLPAGLPRGAHPALPRALHRRRRSGHRRFTDPRGIAWDTSRLCRRWSTGSRA